MPDTMAAEDGTAAQARCWRLRMYNSHARARLNICPSVSPALKMQHQQRVCAATLCIEAGMCLRGAL